MSIGLETSTSSRTRLFDLRTLRSRLRLLMARALPILAVTALLLGVAQFLYPRIGDRARFALGITQDYQIVLEQLHRAESIAAPHILLLGDSSCLMGIYAPMMPSTPTRSTESLCNLGFVGPRGYAHMLDRILARGASPDALVLAMHPISFQRVPGWESATNFVLAGGRTPLPESFWPKGGLNYVRFELADRAIYNPLPGRYGIYFGGMDQFIYDIAINNGSTLDPGSGLEFRSLDEIARIAVPQFGMGTPFDYQPNGAFLEALKPLAQSFSRLDRRRIFLIVTPVPDLNINEAARSQRSKAAATIATRLGLPGDSVLPTLDSLPMAYFSTVTHLNRWGREVFTRDVATKLSQRLLP